MPDAPAILTRKVAGFPVVAWAGMVGGAVGLGLVLRARSKKKAAATAAAGAPTDGTAFVLQPAYTGPEGAVPLPGPGAPNMPTVTGPAGPHRPETNLEWGRMAVEFLVGQGNDPALAQAAIATFLAGQPVTTQMAALISQAIRQLGPPPESVPPMTIAPAPVAAPPPAPPTPPTPSPANPPAAPAAPTGNGLPHEGYPGADNLHLIQTANDLIYSQGPTSPTVRAMVDTLAHRIHVGVLSLPDRQFYESQDPQGKPLAVQALVAARLRSVGW